MGMKILLTGLLILFSVPHAWSAETLEIYISQEGNDKASGSVKEPVQSIYLKEPISSAKPFNLMEEMKTYTSWVGIRRPLVAER